MIKLLKKYYPFLIFLGSIGVFLISFYLIRSFMTNFDEMDHISAVYLMTQGQQLYKDIFATHFPFPFYWAYLFSPLWAHPPFSSAITNLHFSLALFYLLTFTSIFFSFKKNSFKIMFSVWILFISSILGLYHGNLYLSEIFTGLMMSSVLWILIPVFLDKQKLNNYTSFLLILFASIGVWTQPLMIFLLVIPFLLVSSKKEFFKNVLIAFIINIIPIIALIYSGQFNDFYKQAITFNSVVYSHDFPEKVGNNTMLMQTVSDFFSHQDVLLTHFFNSTQIYQFLLNIGLIVFTVAILWKAKLVHKVSLILLLVALMSRQVKAVPGVIFNFGTFPLLLISFICLINLFYPNNFGFKPKFKFISKSIVTLTIILCFIFVTKDNWPILKQSLNPAYNYHVFWSNREKTGKIINDLTKSNERILVYPNDPDFYFFSQRLPMDRFTYWYPWYDKIPEYKQERLNALKNNPPSLIYSGGLGYKSDPYLYAKFFPELLVNYVRVADQRIPTDIWLRKDLKDRIQGSYSIQK